MTTRARILVAVGAAAIAEAGAACGDGGDGGGAVDGGLAADGATGPQDIRATDLALDLAARRGTATISVAPGPGGAVALEIGDLEIDAVTLDGAAASFAAADGVLTVEAAAGGPVELVVDYGFRAHAEFDGWIEARGVTFLWPYFCGNLFPCTSTPDDGVAFTMSITGVADGATAVFPASIPADAPSYMPAVAIGDFTELELGATTAGTALSVWHRPGEAGAAAAGAAHLVAVFDFFETTYGPYTFGAEAGTVSADWGGGDFGGMEHHPFWHVSSGSLASEEVAAHEAAHGWFGNGVRIACWEDFVLSEGTATYAAARALEVVGGPDLWPGYVDELASYCGGGGNTIALPATCGEIDILTDPLWSGVPYVKGACFLEEVADLIGAEVLDGALADFYAAHVGGAARTADLLAAIAARADAVQLTALDALASEWLETLACPADFAARCGDGPPR